jgi:benzoyl-CoA-dihydrodiol lyase
MGETSFEVHPDRYRHIKLEVEGDRARIILKVDENGGLRSNYQLKLNSYDLGVDIELADAVNRLRFEHPAVSVVTLTSGLEDVFCAGANIFMLASSDHGFKVNFCKFTNETRLAMEEASALSGQRYVAALNGITSGGGYELALACDLIWLVDDRRSAVSLPEIPYLGVLPGTGGLTRLLDKRKVRRDLADIFVTLAEGVRGKRAVGWRLVDDLIPRSRFAAEISERVDRLAAPREWGRLARTGVILDALAPAASPSEIRYRHLTLKLDHARRVAELIVAGPARVDPLEPQPIAAGADWYPLRLFREIDDALLRLRFNYPEIGLVLVRSHGDLARVLQIDRQLFAHHDDYFVNEVLLLIRRTLKRMDLTAKSFFALIEPDSCFGGFLFETVLAADRSYMHAGAGAAVAITALNGGAFPMSNGLGRLANRFIDDSAKVSALCAGESTMDADQAMNAGVVTFAPDDLDWDEEVRLAADERLALSPDALTGMEASLRFAGPETMETRIFARLSTWQNWIFQRPNAVGPHGALRLYGRPERPQFDWHRT